MDATNEIWQFVYSASAETSPVLTKYHSKYPKNPEIEKIYNQPLIPSVSCKWMPRFIESDHYRNLFHKNMNDTKEYENVSQNGKTETHTYIGSSVLRDMLYPEKTGSYGNMREYEIIDSTLCDILDAFICSEKEKPYYFQQRLMTIILLDEDDRSVNILIRALYPYLTFSWDVGVVHYGNHDFVLSDFTLKDGYYRNNNFILSDFIRKDNFFSKLFSLTGKLRTI